MKITNISKYTGPRDADGLVDVYDISVENAALYSVLGVIVSNSKRISMLDVNALLSHGAVATLQDTGAVRGQKDERRWLQFMSGYNPTEMKVPFVYEKFVNQLKSAGINVVREGHQTHVMALTNKDVKALAGDSVISSGDTVHFDKDMSPIAGGLFDPKLTGGHGGRRWSSVALPEPLPNPVMEEPIRRLLDLTQKQFNEVLQGKHELPGCGTGPAAIVRGLERVDVDKEINNAREQWKNGTMSARDKALRKWYYLHDLQRLKMNPSDWVLDRVPVLPPVFRPVSVLGDSGVPLISDPNYLYKELIDATNNYQSMKGEVGEKHLGDERLAIYHAFKAVTGLGDPVHPKLQEKGVTGALKTIFGTSPKFGTVQRRLLSSTVDNVGRAVVSPDPGMDMDSLGIPENQAFDVYSKFIVRKLRRRGMDLSTAIRATKDRTELARNMLQEVMEERPVYMNRAPVLHKFGIMAFRPKLVKGDVLKVSPLVVKGLGMDFDGDTAQFHIPSTDKAVQEAYERMLPSRSLLSPADFKSPVHAPGQEYLGGLAWSTDPSQVSKRKPRYFGSKQDAIQAYERGEVYANDPIVVLDS